MRRQGADTGYIIAFSFTRDAREEVARAKWNDGLYIRLVKVDQLLAPPERRTGDLFRAQPADVTELPLPDVRKPKDRPTPQELIASDKAS